MDWVQQQHEDAADEPGRKGSPVRRCPPQRAVAGWLPARRRPPLCQLGLLGGIALFSLTGATAGERASEKPGKTPPAAASVAGVAVDWQRGLIEASASAAADLYAASADVARLKAERLARVRAEDRLRRALASLRSDPRFLARVPGGPAAIDVSRASVSFIDYGSNGSVVLRLSLPLAATPESPAKAPDAAPAGSAQPDLGPAASSPSPTGGPATPDSPEN